MKLFSFFKNKTSSTQATNIDQLIEPVFIEPLEGSQYQASCLVCDLTRAYFGDPIHYGFFDITKFTSDSSDNLKTEKGAPEVFGFFKHKTLSNDTNNVDENRYIHFIALNSTSSRTIIENKLTLDACPWTSCTYKKQTYTPFSNKLTIKENFEYKLAAIINLMLKSPDNSSFTFIGSNTEYDAYLYEGLWLLIKGFLSETGFQKYLELAQIRNDLISENDLNIILKKNHVVKSIYLSSPGRDLSPTINDNSPIQQFDDFLDIALNFLCDDIIHNDGLWHILRTFHNTYGYSRKKISSKLGLFVQSDYSRKINEQLKEYLTQNKFLKDVDEADENTPSNPYNKPNYEFFEGKGEDFILARTKEWLLKALV